MWSLGPLRLQKNKQQALHEERTLGLGATELEFSNELGRVLPSGECISAFL